MMEVQKYLKEHGLKSLIDEFHVDVREYDDRIIVNYNQIESPRFHPVADECRALILRKGTWEVMARSFDRFYNIGEGHDKGPDHIRLPSIDPNEHVIRNIPFEKVIIQEKLDGSIMSLYWDGDAWQVSTRKMGFAEGQTTFGGTFKELFWKAASKYGLREILNNAHDMKQFTIVFELVGPENRVVTPYSEADIILIGGRYTGNDEEINYRELSSTELNGIADGWKLRRPVAFTAKTPEEVIEIVSSMPTMEEGVVLVWEEWNVDASHTRIKCKNPKFVAIAHMRESGGISPKRILTLVMTDEHHEYLGYFPMDKPIFSLVELELSAAVKDIEQIYQQCKEIKSQKDFALYIKDCSTEDWHNGILFEARKRKETIREIVIKIDPKKLSELLHLKTKIFNKLNMACEEEN